MSVKNIFSSVAQGYSPDRSVDEERSLSPLNSSFGSLSLAREVSFLKEGFFQSNAELQSLPLLGNPRKLRVTKIVREYLRNGLAERSTSVSPKTLDSSKEREGVDLKKKPPRILSSIERQRSCSPIDLERDSKEELKSSSFLRQKTASCLMQGALPRPSDLLSNKHRDPFSIATLESLTPWSQRSWIHRKSGGSGRLAPLPK